MRARTLVLSLAVLSLTPTARAAGGGGGGQPASGATADVRKAERLIEQKKWDEAIAVLKKAAERDERNADVFNWLGFAERNRGDTDAAFSYYDRALAIDPKHRGAHEYVGEAYLMVGKPDKAREHLATLETLCGKRCEEYKDLKKEIDEYDRKQTSAAQ